MKYLVGHALILVNDTVAYRSVHYAAELAQSGLADHLDVPTYDQHGVASFATIVLAPAVPPLAQPAPDDAIADDVAQHSDAIAQFVRDIDGRLFQDTDDFNTQLRVWLIERANLRKVRSIGGRPAELDARDRASMQPLPSVAPTTGLRTRVRLARDYYVRVDGNDYSADPRCIGRFVDVHAALDEVRITCSGESVGRHGRSLRTGQTITDPDHVTVAARLRAHYQAPKPAAVRSHQDGHRVQIRALSDYDVLFGVDFTTDTTTKEAR